MIAFVPRASADIFDWLRTSLFGWADFLRRVLPDLTVDRNSVILALGALLLFTLGVHIAAKRLTRKFAVNAADPPPRWRLRSTLALVAMTYVLFAAGIAVIGLVHQSVWLATSKDPLISDSAVTWNSSTEDSLRSIDLAIGIQHDLYNSLPSGGTFADDGTALHSWETRILLGLNYSHDAIDMKHPWRAPVNIERFRTVLPEFINPGFRTAEFLDAEGFGLSHFASNVRTMGPNTKMTFDDITDGLGQTILIGEVNTGFRPWGDPVNWRDPAAGLGPSPATFGGPPATESTTFLMADGSVRVLNNQTDPAILRALATPAASDTVPH